MSKNLKDTYIQILRKGLFDSFGISQIRAYCQV